MTRRPLLLDLFCGAGGCAVGYHRAGFDVVGVDNRPQPRFPFPFYQSCAMQAMQLLIGGHSIRCSGGELYYLKDFAAIHASPPCQGYSISRNNGMVKAVPKLIEHIRNLLVKSGKVWAIEGVAGSPMFYPAVLCGASFGLGVAGLDMPRHRLFECSLLVMTPPCRHRRGKTIGVYGNGTNSWHREKMGRCLSVAEARKSMGIGWMTRAELSQAIPPAYTHYIGKQLLAVLHANRLTP